MRIFLYCLLLPLSTASAAPAAAEQAYSVSSHWRELGYSIGDTAQQTIIIETPVGYALDTSSLPAPGPNSTAVELVQTEIKTEQHNQTTRHHISLLWQSFQAMQEIRPYPLRALDLSFKRKQQSIAVHVDAASIMVASVLPTAMNAARAQPLADVKPVAADTRQLLRQLGAALLLCMLSLSYLAWRYDWLRIRCGRNQPFRLAWRQIKKQQKSAGSPPATALAMQVLCRAFDASAGFSVSSEQLPLLLARQPSLRALAPEIVDFYAASEQLFFAGTSRMHYSQIRNLAQRLMLMETA
jgi:mxaA protein